MTTRLRTAGPQPFCFLTRDSFGQISVYRDAPMGNSGLPGRQLSDSFCLTRFDTAEFKFQFIGMPRWAMRYGLRRSNHILRAPRAVACTRSAYTLHQISVYRSVSPFLFRQERCPKEAAIGEALSAGQLPRQSRPPLCTPPGSHLRWRGAP